MADELLAEKPLSGLRLVKGMAEYRAGQFDEALATLPTTGGERALPISLLFRAMTHHQLGDLQAAREEYDRALQEIDRWTPTPSTGPELNEHSPARWVLWCRHQALRREAEALLGDGEEQEEAPQEKILEPRKKRNTRKRKETCRRVRETARLCTCLTFS